MRAGLSVGEIARRSGVAVSALHFYETKGLIASDRSAGNQRRYEPNVLRRVAIIGVAQEVGVSLADIAKAFATLPEGRTPNKADWQRLSIGWRDHLDHRIAQLEHLRDGLSDCIGCGCLSIDTCPLRNPDDRLADRGPGPHLLGVAGPKHVSRKRVPVSGDMRQNRELQRTERI